MSECLPDLPRYIRQRGDEWQGADHQGGPWRPIPAPQSRLPWKTDGPAVPESREPASVAADARRLSPASAILTVFRERYDETLRPGPFVDRWQEQCIAAALRAAADQVAPNQKPWNRTSDASDAKHMVRLDLLAIAAELEEPNA